MSQISRILKSRTLLLIVMTLVVFSPSLFNDFQMAWDDKWQVLENPYVIDPSFNNLFYHFTEFYSGQYSPVNTMVYVGIHKLFGFNPSAFHAVFLIFHVFNLLLVLSIIKTVLTVIKPNLGPRHIHLYTFFAGLIFAIHPLQVEVVAWISASKVIMYTFFMLIGIWCYLRYLQSGRKIWLLAVILMYALSFGSKEQAIILPMNLLIIDYAFRRFSKLKFNLAFLRSKVVLEKIPYFAIALVFWYFSYSFGLGKITDFEFPIHQRVLMGMHSLMEYIFRSIAPVKLYFYHSIPITRGETLPWFYWCYVPLVFIVILFAWRQYKKNNQMVFFGALFFLINLLLVIHILPMPRLYITADRYMYVSIIGLSLIGVWFIDTLYKKYPFHKKHITISLVFYVLFLCTQTFFRTREWKNSDTMKRNVKELLEKRKIEKTNSIDNKIWLIF